MTTIERRAKPEAVHGRYPQRQRSASVLKHLEEHYREMQEVFDERRAHFARHGELHHRWADGKFTEETRVALADLGGYPFEGNWASGTDFPLIRKTVATDAENAPVAVPLTEDGRPFRYVGGLESYNYTFTHGCYLLLFYDPKTATALTTFDWT